jgi:long-chain acyl-CoA synthetase
MLYDRWQQILAQRRSELALSDLRSGLQYTFAQLDAAAASVGAGDVLVPYRQESGIEFVIAVLRAWRGATVMCALESSQIPPKLTGMPPQCAHVKLTSASTGAARAVLFTAEQLAADAANIVETMGLRPDWPNLGVISLAHSYGFSNLVLPLLLHGIPLHLCTPLPEAVRSAAAALGAATLPAVPALWKSWHEARAISPNVRLAISAGAPLPVELERDIFAASGLKIHNFYGATECGGIAYDRSDTPRTGNAVVGEALHNVELSLAKNGCLVVRSKAVGMTYWPESDPALADGRFKTNDLVELQEGRVILRGRAGDLINVAGRKVSPELIEEALRSMPKVRDCIVFGVPNGESGRGEVIVACVAAAGQTAEALRASVAGRLAPWQIPREWLLLDALPLNERGKLSRAEWRKRYLSTSRRST